MAQQKNSISVIENGPLQVEGEVMVYNTISELVASESPVMLCRCGASKNKPFCDGSHEQIGFSDCCQVDNSKDEELEAYTPLTITCRPNGMLVVKGPMTIIGPDGKSQTRRNKAALCRCGASRNKPFCDISHKKINFVDDALITEQMPDSAAPVPEPGLEPEVTPTPTVSSEPLESPDQADSDDPEDSGQDTTAEQQTDNDSP